MWSGVGYNDEHEENGDSDNVARVKTENALLLVYRKELLEYLQWMRAMNMYEERFHLPYKVKETH